MSRAHISKSKRCFIVKFSHEDEDIGRFSNPHWCTFEGAMKLYFVHYWRVVMILFSVGLCSSYFVPSIL